MLAFAAIAALVLGLVSLGLIGTLRLSLQSGHNGRCPRAAACRRAASCRRAVRCPESQGASRGLGQYLAVPVEVTNSIGMKLALIPPGEFMMGSPEELIEEELMHMVTTRGTRIVCRARRRGTRYGSPGRSTWWTEVTQEEFQRVMGSNPSLFRGDLKRPVEQVLWDEAAKFCRKLSNLPEERTRGRTYRLPSEAQWEYACREGNAGRYSFSSGRSEVSQEEEQTVSDYGWFKDNSGGMTMPWAGNEPAAGDCLTCRATCGSGARTGTTRIIMRSWRKTTPSVPAARSAYSAAVAGATRRGSSCGVPTNTAVPAAVTATWASASL